MQEVETTAGLNVEKDSRETRNLKPQCPAVLTLPDQTVELMRMRHCGHTYWCGTRFLEIEPSLANSDTTWRKEQGAASTFFAADVPRAVRRSFALRLAST